MYIKCWGSRGSISVSGVEYNRYGGDTTCLEVRTADGQVIVVDAGTGIRRLGNQLAEEDVAQFHLLFTHAHWDHIMGFPHFKPLFMRRFEIQMHRCPFHRDFVRQIIERVLTPPHFPIRYEQIKANLVYQEACPQPFRIGAMDVIPIPMNHPNGGSGYKFVENGASFVFLTDNELGYQHPGGLSRNEYIEHIANVDLLIHDAEFTPREYGSVKRWGHSCYTHAVDLASEGRVKQLGLFHHNQDRTDEQVDAIVRRAQARIQQSGNHTSCLAVAADATFNL